MRIEQLKDLLNNRKAKLSADYQTSPTENNSMKLVGRTPTPVESMLSEDAFWDGHESLEDLLIKAVATLESIKVHETITDAYDGSINYTNSGYYAKLALEDIYRKLREFDK